MASFYVTIYLVCFALLFGGAFSLMWVNVRSVLRDMDKPKQPIHPESPSPGEEVLYVDFSREKLEKLYND